VRRLRARGPDAATRVWAQLQRYDPDIVVYFSGNAKSAYQLNMWLELLEQLPHRAFLLLRERRVFEALAPTRLPAVCVPSAVSIMQAALPARIAFYAANVSKNTNLLREPGLRHVFIGHGDSDKVSSVNPVARVYDEVWVAGKAGRDRWLNADVGVRDDAIVEVGRPQLHGIERVPSGRLNDLDRPLTVLYAPTWEGWTDETFATSVTDMGPVLVRRLLEVRPRVRVVFKPHPFTGLRDRRARLSSDKIAAMLKPEPHPRRRELAALERRLNNRQLSPEDHEALEQEWSAMFWSELPMDQHVTVTERPALFDCFNHADLMIADVSSVVSDFLASGKPYICANTRGEPADVFRAQNPSTAAAYLLGPDCSEIGEILRQVREADPLAAARDGLREYLLGPDDPPPLQQWTRAVDALLAKPRRRSAGQPDFAEFDEEFGGLAPLGADED
jgi:hypothetical protein